MGKTTTKKAAPAATDDTAGAGAPATSDTEYPPEALGSREAAQKALKFALHRRPNLEADLADVIRYVGLPADEPTEQPQAAEAATEL